MLVRIKTDRLNLVLPIPYFLLVQAMEAIADLLWIGEKLLPSSINRLCLDHHSNQGSAKFSRENCLQTSDLRSMYAEAEEVARPFPINLVTEKGALPSLVEIVHREGRVLE